VPPTVLGGMMERMGKPREQRLGEVFVSLADTLVADYDVIDLLYNLSTACVELLAVDTAGIMVTADGKGSLQTVASSHERTELLELFQLQNDEGPCLDTFRQGQPVTCLDLAHAGGRWPKFSAHAVDRGYRSVHTRPMRVRDTVVGALNLFGDHTGAVPETDLYTAQALADIATISIIKDRTAATMHQLVEQLQSALNSRVIIEQAKGMLAARLDIDMDDAFARLRHHARSHHDRLTDVARKLLDGTIHPDSMAPAGRAGLPGAVPSALPRAR
jgi:transcriptional regulator with GAF, ATPase, and Fis domain